jgi:hypothetical protein
MIRLSIQEEQFEADVFIKAIEILRKQYHYKKDSFFDTCQFRIFDVEYEGLQKTGQFRGLRSYKIHRNEKLDKGGMKWKHRRVYLGKDYSWCNCLLARKKWSNYSFKTKCTHIAVAHLFVIYCVLLSKKYQISIGRSMADLGGQVK